MWCGSQRIRNRAGPQIAAVRWHEFSHMCASGVGSIPTTQLSEGATNMTVRRMALVVGAVILLVGIIGLLMPVSVSDENGGKIGCGNAVISDTKSAESANNKSVASIPILNQIVPHTDFVAECHSALSSRRSWTIPVAVIGAIAVIAALFVRGGRSPSV